MHAKGSHLHLLFVHKIPHTQLCMQQWNLYIVWLIRIIVVTINNIIYKLLPALQRNLVWLTQIVTLTYYTKLLQLCSSKTCTVKLVRLILTEIFPWLEGLPVSVSGTARPRHTRSYDRSLVCKLKNFWILAKLWVAV